MTQINPNQINPGAATDKQVIAFDQASGEFTIQDQQGSGGGLNIGDMFFCELTLPNTYSNRYDLYTKYTSGIVGGGGRTGYNDIYYVNGKGAPIMKNGAVYHHYRTYPLNINDSYYYTRTDFVMILGTEMRVWNKIADDYYNQNTNYYAVYYTADFDAANPVRVGVTLDAHWNQTTGTFGSHIVGYDGTYLYYYNVLTGVYEYYTVVGTTVTYVGVWTPPAGPTGISFIQGPFIYYVNGHVITKYSITTGATIDIQYYGTRNWNYDNGIRTNINTTGDMHAIFKTFSN